MFEQFSRTALLLGEDAMNTLNNSRVAIFGIGGVGGYTAEALARCGIGELDLIDSDSVSLSNINRQIYATYSTVGRLKIDVAAERLHDINPHIKVNTYNLFVTTENADAFEYSKYDYIVDAIDTVSGKIAIIENAKLNGNKIISCMGAGNKFDPLSFEINDIYNTSVCPLARVMRRELKKRNIKSLKVLYSKEIPSGFVIDKLSTADKNTENEKKKNPPGSLVFTVAAAGLIIAGEVIKDLIGQYGRGPGV